MNRISWYCKSLGSAIARVYLLPLYFLSGLVPRRSTLWVFGSWGGNRYSDNSAAFFEYCNAEFGDRVDLVWISRRRAIVSQLRARGLRAHWIWSVGGVVCSLRAGVYVFDSFLKDINFWLSRNSFKVNLWSGVPLKKCEREIDNPRSRYYRLFHGSLPERWLLGAMMPWHVVKPDLTIATSQLTRQVTCRTFDVAADAVAVTGFPRNDALFADRESIAASLLTLPEEFAEAVRAGLSVYLYLPTYRDSGKEFLEIDWTELDRAMARQGGMFFLKFHPDHVGTFSGGLERVRSMPKDIDIYDLLPHTTALISDYSSIIFDYMLLERPIVYYVPDLEEFAASSRTFNFQPRDVAAGPLCRSSDELIAALDALAGQASTDTAQRAHWDKIRRDFNEHLDGHSSARVLDALAERIPAVRRAAARSRSPEVARLRSKKADQARAPGVTP